MLYLIIQPKNVGVSIAANAVPTAKLSYLKHIIDLVPAGIFTPFIEHQVIGVLLVSALIGFAIRHIQNTDVRDTISNFFKAVHEIFLVITGWVVKIIPIGLYGFIATSVIQFKSGVDIRGIGAYLAVVVLANVIQGVVVLPGWLLMNGINPIATFKGVSSALSLAFFSKSSAGTLPVTIMNAEKNLRIDSKISRLLLPICTTINMNGCAAFIFTTVIYLMQNHGIAIDVSTMLIWIVIATIAAVGNAGVPMGCFFLSASLLASQNVPIGLLGIILPFYSVIDMIETSLNVWSDVCVTKTVAQKVR
jgi:Na+/H+-dicarboxylate symporter